MLQAYHLTGTLSRRQYHADVGVDPGAAFEFQAVVTEDKGRVGGVDWYRSPIATFKTTTVDKTGRTDEEES